MSTIKTTTNIKTGVKKAAILSGIKCATSWCVFCALSSIILRTVPDSCTSKKAKDAFIKCSIATFRKLFSSLKPKICEAHTAANKTIIFASISETIVTAANFPSVMLFVTSTAYKNFHKYQNALICNTTPTTEKNIDKYTQCIFSGTYLNNLLYVDNIKTPS